MKLITLFYHSLLFMVDECFIIPLMFASQFIHVWLIQFISIKFMDIHKKKHSLSKKKKLKNTMRKNKKISRTIKYQLTTTIPQKTKTKTYPNIFFIQLNK